MLRITGGIFGGRLIQAPHNQQTRPTQAKLRQALFNSLQAYVPESKVLDLFAGSGSLGFEALSRGASQVVFVENSKPAIQLIRKNAQSLGVLQQIELITEPISLQPNRIQSFCPFDLVFADPPYAAGWELKLLEGWPWHEILSPSGRFCIEWGNQKSQISELPERISGLVKVREKNYGESVLTTYLREATHDTTHSEISDSESDFDR